MREMTYVSQLAFVHEISKPELPVYPCQRIHKMQHKKGLPNPSQNREDIKCISACDDQTLQIPSNTKNASKHALTKSYQCKSIRKNSSCVEQTIPCKLAHKMHVNMCQPNPPPSNASEDTICISICVHQTQSRTARPLNTSIIS